ncbi:hypothetical protein EVAR_81209_1 [Eumeta japonica]|uniref:Uncharacterized protein n=1 Tax=Eumeta variegata TaxID=151549 RepID=A0A4C1V284_EUMVA|nr:hypothetical protein EVAR_81209_1 [Eumeta japonica]
MFRRFSKYTKLCSGIPLRYVLLTFGYVNVVLSSFVFGLLIWTAVDLVRRSEYLDEGYLHFEFELPILMYFMGIISNVLLVIAAHRHVMLSCFLLSLTKEARSHQFTKNHCRVAGTRSRMRGPVHTHNRHFNTIDIAALTIESFKGKNVFDTSNRVFGKEHMPFGKLRYDENVELLPDQDSGSNETQVSCIFIVYKLKRSEEHHRSKNNQDHMVRTLGTSPASLTVHLDLSSIKRFMRAHWY